MTFNLPNIALFLLTLITVVLLSNSKDQKHIRNVLILTTAFNACAIVFILFSVWGNVALPATTKAELTSAIGAVVLVQACAYFRMMYGLRMQARFSRRNLNLRARELNLATSLTITDSWATASTLPESRLASPTDIVFVADEDTFYHRVNGHLVICERFDKDET